MNKSMLLVAIKASLNAGEAILKIYQKEDFKSYVKDDKSPLTEADLLSNEIITKSLLETGVPIISEENKLLEYSERKLWDRCWIVDPIDGTKEFIKRNGEFTVNISLVYKNVTELGVIYVPVSRELYYTNENKSKAFKLIVPDDYSQIENILFRKEDELLSKELDNDKIRVVGSRSHMNEDTLSYVDKLKTEYKDVEIVSKGSSLKFCLVAESKADVYPRFAPTMEWDTAAGQAICEAVGLKVIDQKTNKPMLYNRKYLLNNYFLVSK